MTLQDKNINAQDELATNQLLPRGQTANLGAGVVPGQLQIIGVGAHYTISINGGPAIANVIAPGTVDTYKINGQSVSVSNTTPVAGPPNMTLSW